MVRPGLSKNKGGFVVLHAGSDTIQKSKNKLIISSQKDKFCDKTNVRIYKYLHMVKNKSVHVVLAVKLLDL